MPNTLKVYTRTGDEGTACLYTGQRRDKDDLVFEALGDADELNSAIGVASQYCSSAGNGISEQLGEIQSRILDVGSAIATPLGEASLFKAKRATFDAEAVAKLEAWIDEMDDKLDPLTSFILPSGGLASANLHVARTVCRRVERRAVCEAAGRLCTRRGKTVALARDGKLEDSVRVYLNRLSDYLFTAARFAAKFEGAEPLPTAAEALVRVPIRSRPNRARALPPVHGHFPASKPLVPHGPRRARSPRAEGSARRPRRSPRKGRRRRIRA
eukprot:scaffold1167_cov418-Prasinococcus_capsulatus_cf.AAC.30